LHRNFDVRLNTTFNTTPSIPVQARVQTANQVLCGYFVIPDTMDRALEVTINPIGNRTRSELRAWNDGHQRLKLVGVY
jgi:hypothetical protein